MGLFRLFWGPVGTRPSQGTYVRYPGHDLLSLLCLEALRAGAYVVGEDLGTVEDEVREVLARRGVLSYKLLWFEPGRPATWPHQALGAVTTHDLPTIAGVWSGSDLTAQRSAGVCPNEEGFASLRRRLEDWTGSGQGRPASEVIEASYGLLPSRPAHCWPPWWRTRSLWRSARTCPAPSTSGPIGALRCRCRLRTSNKARWLR